MPERRRREDDGLAMCPAWSEALWRFQRAPRTTEHRTRQIEVVAAIHDLLDPIGSTATLAAHYRAETSAELCHCVAQALHPTDDQLSDLRRTRDVAYALRYIELVTGHELDLTLGLPYWIGEWAVY